MLFKLLILTLLLNAKPSHADVKYIATRYAIIPGSEEERDWERCSEISPSYMAELMSFRELARDLHNLVMGGDFPGRAIEVKKMRAQLKIHSDRLLQLARPEWNIENRRWHLKWTIPGAEFFDAMEPDLDWPNLPPLPKGKFLAYTAGEIKLLGERRADLRERLWVELGKGYRRNVEVMISKEATFLEFCQMARSIEIDLSIDYESPRTLGFPSNKKYKLIFAEDL